MAFVVFPWLELGHLSPIIDDDNVTITPWDSFRRGPRGRKSLRRQRLRLLPHPAGAPATSGADIIRGWGTAFSPEDPKDPKKEVTRRSYPRDYIWQGQTFLGNSRDGRGPEQRRLPFPDRRRSSTRYLYDPDVLNPHSSMPAYRFLFRHAGRSAASRPGRPRAAQGRRSARRLRNRAHAEARSLVAYLLSLNKGYHLKPDEAGLRYELLQPPPRARP